MHFDPFHPSNFVILKIQDGGSLRLGKSTNRHISATVRPITAKFDTVMHFGKAWRSTAELCHAFLVWLGFFGLSAGYGLQKTIFGDSWSRSGVGLLPKQQYQGTEGSSKLWHQQWKSPATPDRFLVYKLTPVGTDTQHTSCSVLESVQLWHFKQFDLSY